MLDKFKIGHSDNGEMATGITVILAEEGATGGVSVRGSAPATRETDLLDSDNSVDKINAVFLAGGSAFGLNAAAGIMQYLADKNVGYPTAVRNIPIVCGACLYDLDYKVAGYPTPEMGYEACYKAFASNFVCGDVGAGCGATVGKILGAQSAVKSGLGLSTYKFPDGVEMCAIVAVNAFGDIYDYKNGVRVKGATFDGSPIKMTETIANSTKGLEWTNSNTTIGCILTNAKLTKSQANKLADIAHDGYAMCIRPVHTLVDGDVIFSMASGDVEGDFMRLSCYAPILMAEAILNASK